MSIRTKRLKLRNWCEDDIEPFARMCADREVMKYFPKLLSFGESAELATHLQSMIDSRGWGIWAIELQSSSSSDISFIGFVGLHETDDLPFAPCVEIAWRLAKPYWGNGYATEAAVACLDFGFGTLGLEEILSFTSTKNIASQRVMRRLGMKFVQQFKHPSLPPENPLSDHVLFKLTNQQWQDSPSA